ALSTPARSRISRSTAGSSDILRSCGNCGRSRFIASRISGFNIRNGWTWTWTSVIPAIGGRETGLREKGCRSERGFGDSWGAGVQLSHERGVIAVRILARAPVRVQEDVLPGVRIVEGEDRRGDGAASREVDAEGDGGAAAMMSERGLEPANRLL